MGYSSELSADERRHLNGMIDDNMTVDDAVDSTKVARRLYAELLASAEDGDMSAQQMIAGVAVDGLRSHVVQHIKKDRSVIVLRNNRGAVNVPARVGIRAIDGNGRELRYSQQAFWWELSWDRFIRMIAGLVAQRDKLSQNIDAFTELLVLRQQFADTRTPGEACERAGIDPRSYGLEEEELRAA